MSEPRSDQREWRFYLDDMIAFAQKVRDYTEEQMESKLKQETVIACSQPDVYTLSYIRPTAVSPLNHPEGEPIPWGFFFSSPVKPILRLTQGAQIP